MIIDDAAVAARLLAIRKELAAKVWPTAIEAAASNDHERIRDLVKLKVDIEAIDFALRHRTAQTPEAHRLSDTPGPQSDVH